MPESACDSDARAAGLRARRQRYEDRRCTNLTVDTVLFDNVQHFLSPSVRWWLSQIAGALKRMWPHNPEATVSH